MITFNIAETDNIINKNIKALTALIYKTINAFNIDN